MAAGGCRSIARHVVLSNSAVVAVVLNVRSHELSGCEIARCPLVCVYVRTYCTRVHVRRRLPPQVRRGPPHVVGSPAAAENKAHVRHAAAHYAHVVLPAVASWEPLPDMPDDVCHLGAPGFRLQHVLRAACKDIRGMAHQQGCVGGEDMRVCVCV